MIYLIICLLLIVANLYMVKVNTDSYYKLVAQKKYHKANVARRLVVINLAMAVLFSGVAVWASF